MRYFIVSLCVGCMLFVGCVYHHVADIEPVFQKH